jgi:peptide/nickel transport system permease protein
MKRAQSPRDETVAARSPLRIAVRRLRGNPTAMAAVAVLALLYLIAILADFLAPYGYDSEVRDTAYAPPQLLWRDAAGRFHFRPFVYRRWYDFDPETNARIWHEDRSKRYPVALFARGSPHRLLGLIKTEIHLFGLGAPVPETTLASPAQGGPQEMNVPSEQAVPARLYLFGADGRGRCLFSRLCYGARISMSIGLVGSAITFILGMLIGGVSGYFGGATDTVIQRVCEMVMMVPGFYLMLALRSALPMDMPSGQVYLLLVFIMSFIGWAGFARVIRGLVLSIRTREYVLAAKAMGTRPLSIIARHVLPNTFSYAVISLTMGIPGYILGESGLSMIGLGIQDPQVSWGNLLSEAMEIAQIRYHPWILLPGLFIFLAVMSFNMLGDGLRDAFDPQGITRRVGR